jgi:DNA (cytosine-5)-methyltransferase 1
MNKCEDNPTASIYKKCKVRMLGLEEKETLDDGKTDASEFHCR